MKTAQSKISVPLTPAQELDSLPRAQLIEMRNERETARQKAIEGAQAAVAAAKRKYDEWCAPRLALEAAQSELTSAIANGESQVRRVEGALRRGVPKNVEVVRRRLCTYREQLYAQAEQSNYERSREIGQALLEAIRKIDDLAIYSVDIEADLQAITRALPILDPLS